MDDREPTEVGSYDYRVANSEAEAQGAPEAQAVVDPFQIAPTATEKALQLVDDMIDRATTDRFVGIESVVDQQSIVINELRDHALVMAGQIDALTKLVANMLVDGQVAPQPQPKPKPVKGEVMELPPPEGETT